MQNIPTNDEDQSYHDSPPEAITQKKLVSPPILLGTLLLGKGKGIWGDDIEGHLRELRKDRDLV